MPSLVLALGHHHQIFSAAICPGLPPRARFVMHLGTRTPIQTLRVALGRVHGEDAVQVQASPAALAQWELEG